MVHVALSGYENRFNIWFDPWLHCLILLFAWAPFGCFYIPAWYRREGWKRLPVQTNAEYERQASETIHSAEIGDQKQEIHRSIDDENGSNPSSNSRYEHLGLSHGVLLSIFVLLNLPSSVPWLGFSFGPDEEHFTGRVTTVMSILKHSWQNSIDFGNDVRPKNSRTWLSLTSVLVPGKCTRPMCQGRRGCLYIEPRMMRRGDEEIYSSNDEVLYFGLTHNRRRLLGFIFLAGPWLSVMIRLRWFCEVNLA